MGEAQEKLQTEAQTKAERQPSPGAPVGAWGNASHAIASEADNPDAPLQLPALFLQLIGQQYAAGDVQRIVSGCTARRATTLRANTLLATRDEVASALDAAGLAYRTVSWYGDAFVLEPGSEEYVRALPLYEQGKVYLQSLSSMMPPLALAPAAGQDVLDMCAAPGGKTTQMAALGGKGCHITACEMHAPRAQKLQHNLAKLGSANVTLMQTDARQLDEFFRFDRILLDAPCTGSGTLYARDAKAQSRFTPKLLQKTTKSQSALLDKALQLMKPGAQLVYSTCSIFAAENEQAVRGALDRAAKRKHSQAKFEIAPIEFSGDSDIPRLPTTLEGSACVCPTNTYEGFFMAKLVRVK